MTKYFELRNETLNGLLGGGIYRGEGLLIEYDIDGIADPLFVSTVVDVFDNLVSAVLVPRRSITRAEIDAYLAAFDVSMEALLDNDQLFIIDTEHRWEDHTNVFQVSDLSDIQDATETALGRSRARGTVHMLDINSIVAAIGPEQARTLREWYQTDAFRGQRDYLVEGALVPDLPTELVEFYETADRQVISLSQVADELRLTVQSVPDAPTPKTVTVKFLDHPPFVTLS